MSKVNIKFIKSRKNSGFTLIEMLAVIGIILTLAGILFPKVAGYINEAKELKVVDQCRKTIMAAETYNLKYSELNKSEKIGSILNKEGIKDYLVKEDLKNIEIENTTLQDCYDIIEGKEFSLKKQESGTMVLDSSTIGKVHSKEEVN